MNRKVEAITRRIVHSLNPLEPAPVVPRVNGLFQFVLDGMPVEIAIANKADTLTENVENARYRRSSTEPSALALSHLIKELALDGGQSAALSRQRGSNTYKTHLSLDQYAVRHIYVSPSTVTTERGIVIPGGMMAVTQIRSTKDNTLEQTFVAVWTNPRDLEDNGTIYTGFHLQAPDHLDKDIIKVLQCSVDPDSKTTLLRVSSATDEYHDYRFRLKERIYFDFDGGYLATVGNGQEFTLY